MMHRTPLLISLLALATVATAQTAFTTAVSSNSSTTNQLRSLALAQDGTSIYGGFIQTSGNRDVRRYSTTAPYGMLNARPFAGGDQPKAIATDDRGYVFTGNRLSGTNNAVFTVSDAALNPLSTYNASSTEFGGASVRKVGAQYFLYVSRESGSAINRYDVTDPNAISLDTSFGTGGTYTLPGVNADLRGLEVSDDGTIFVTSRGANALYRVSNDLTSVLTASLTRAFDVALFNNVAYVTSYNGANSLVGTFDATTLASLGNLTVGSLDGAAYTRGTAEGFSGIDIGSDGRIWINDQAYGTSNGATLDRLIVAAPVPEPSAFAALGLGVVAILRRRRKG